MAKKIVFEEEARLGLRTGADILAKTVVTTMGPAGRTVMTQRLNGPMITKDGVSVARDVELENALHNMGAALLKESSKQTVASAGDGTTTSALMASKLLQEMHTYVDVGYSPILVKKGMDKAAAEATAYIKEVLSTPVETISEIERIATLSSNGDQHLGSLIATAIETAGKEGVITVEEGSGVTTTLEFAEGYQIDRGYLDQKFLGDPSLVAVDWEDVAVLIANKKLSSVHESLPVLQYLLELDRPVVIVAHDFDGDFLPSLYQNVLGKVISAIPVKAPFMGFKREEVLKDLAVLTGGMVVDDLVGQTFKDLNPADIIGFAGKVSVNSSHTTFLEGACEDSALESRIAHARNGADRSQSEHDREFHQQRASFLGGGVAVLRVGAQTESELKEYKARVEDALAATRAALRGGFVLGGGVTYLHASHHLKAVASLQNFLSMEEELGWKVVVQALEAPFLQILLNAGLKAERLLAEYEMHYLSDLCYVYDLRTDGFVDGLEAGILDPTQVVVSVINHAVSVASTIGMVACAIYKA